MIDGVILDDYSRAIAYRVDGEGNGESQDIAARNLFPAFCPLVTGQVRGFSLLASSVFDWQDMAEWRRFEMLAQKVFSTRTLIETNETGDAQCVDYFGAAGAVALNFIILNSLLF